MNDTQALTLFCAALCTISLLIGWLSGSRERRLDDEVEGACRWHDHVQQALYTARRTTVEAEDLEDTR